MICCGGAHDCGCGPCTGYGLRVGGADECEPQFLPQFISPGDARDAVARVNVDATRLDEAIGKAGINAKDPAWWSQWFAWFIAWKEYEAKNRDWSSDIFDAPTIYTECCKRTVELREWYAQAAKRGAVVGVTPTSPREAGSTTIPFLALGVAAVAALLLLRKA